MTTEEMLRKAKKLGWNVTEYRDDGRLTDYELGMLSPAGQDFFLTLDADDPRESLGNYIENFDVSRETMLWVDSEGHGKNGAPYDIRDIIADMEWCLKRAEKLYRSWI